VLAMTDEKMIKKSKNGLNVIFIHGINSNQDCWRYKSKDKLLSRSESSAASSNESDQAIIDEESSQISTINGSGKNKTAPIKGESYWPNLLRDEDKLADIGIYNFSYRTAFNTGSYSLGDVVSSLREYFQEYNLFDSSEIIFVCHSMGGIVARRFLVTEERRFFKNDSCRIGLFLLASPSLGSGYANMLSLVSKALRQSQAKALRFSQSNEWLNDLDTDFMNLKENRNKQIFGKELIEDLPIFLKRLMWWPQVVKPFSGARYFGESFKIPGSDHFTIATPKDKDDHQHRALVRFINENSLISTSENQQLKK
jgi:pimeloyl-ACP methyl ester carboxylesterase